MVNGFEGADRVILGLLPQPWDGIQTAIDALRPTGGILHVHGIAPVENPESWESEVIDRLKETLLMQKSNA